MTEKKYIKILAQKIIFRDTEKNIYKHIGL